MDGSDFPRTYKDFFQYSVLQDACSTCLSKGRKIFSLDEQQRSLLGVLGIKMTNIQKVCWECRAKIENIFAFQQTALDAQRLLQLKDWKANNVIGSMSSLQTTELLVNLDIPPVLPQNHHNEMFHRGSEVKLHVTATPKALSPRNIESKPYMSLELGLDKPRESVIKSIGNSPPLKAAGSGSQHFPKCTQITTEQTKYPKLVNSPSQSLSTELAKLQLESISRNEYTLQPERIPPNLVNMQPERILPNLATLQPEITSPNLAILQLKRISSNLDNLQPEKNSPKLSTLQSERISPSMATSQSEIITRKLSTPQPGGMFSIQLTSQPAKMSPIQVQPRNVTSSPDTLYIITMKHFFNKPINRILKPAHVSLTGHVTHTEDISNRQVPTSKPCGSWFHIPDETDTEKTPDNAVLKVDRTKTMPKTIDCPGIDPVEIPLSDKSLDEVVLTQKNGDDKTTELLENSDKINIELQYKSDMINGKTKDYWSLTRVEDTTFTHEQAIGNTMISNEPSNEVECVNEIFKDIPHVDTLSEVNDDGSSTLATVQSLIIKGSLHENKVIAKPSSNIDISKKSIEILPQVNYTDYDANDTDCESVISNDSEELSESEKSLNENKRIIESQSMDTNISNENIETLPETYDDDTDCESVTNDSEKLSESDKTLDENKIIIDSKTVNTAISNENKETLAATYDVDNDTDCGCVTNDSEELPESQKSLDKNKRIIESQTLHTDISKENIEILSEAKYTDYDYNNTVCESVTSNDSEELPESEKSLNEKHTELQTLNINMSKENIDTLPKTYDDDDDTDCESVTNDSEELSESENTLDGNKRIIESQTLDTNISNENIETLPETYDDDNDCESVTNDSEELSESEESLDENEINKELQTKNTQISKEYIETLPETYDDDSNNDQDPATSHDLKELLKSKESPDESRTVTEKERINTTKNNTESLETFSDDDIDIDLDIFQVLNEIPEIIDYLDKEEIGEEIVEQTLQTKIGTENTETVFEEHDYINKTDNKVTVQFVEELPESVDSVEANKNKQNMVKRTSTGNPTKNTETLVEMYSNDNNTIYNNPETLQCLDESPKTEEIKKQSINSGIPTDILETVPGRCGDYNKTDNYLASLHFKESSYIVKDLDKKLSTYTDTLTKHTEIPPDTRGFINNSGNNPAVPQLEESPANETIDQNKDIEKQYTETTTKNIETLPETRGDENSTDHNPVALQNLQESPESMAIIESVEEFDNPITNTENPAESLDHLPASHSDSHIDNDIIKLMYFKKLLNSNDSIVENKDDNNERILDNTETNIAQPQLREAIQEETVDIVMEKSNRNEVSRNSSKFDDKNNYINLPAVTKHYCIFEKDCPLLNCHNVNSNATKRTQEYCNKKSVEQQNNLNRDVVLDNAQNVIILSNLDLKDVKTKKDSLISLISQTNKINPTESANYQTITHQEDYNYLAENNLQTDNIKNKQTADERTEELQQLNKALEENNCITYMKSITNENVAAVNSEMVLLEHNYCKTIDYKRNVDETTQNTIPNSLLREQNGIRKIESNEATNDTARENLIEASIIETIIHNIDLEIAEDDSNASKDNLKAHEADPNMIKFSLDNDEDYSKVIASDDETDSNVDVGNSEDCASDPTLINVQVDNCDTETVDGNECEDWTVEGYKRKKQHLDSLNEVHIVTSGGTSILDTDKNPTSMHQSFEEECSNNEDFLSKPLEYHYECSPSENSRYSYDGCNSNQIPGDLESDNLTICFSNTLFDFGSENMTIIPNEGHVYDPNVTEGDVNNSKYDNVRIMSPDLLEPVCYASWQDETYHHINRNNNEESPESIKGKQKQSNEVVNASIEVEKDGVGDPPLKKKRGRKRKREEFKWEISELVEHKNKLKLKCSKKFKTRHKEIINNIESPMENKESKLEGNKPKRKRKKLLPAEDRSLPTENKTPSTDNNIPTIEYNTPTDNKTPPRERKKQRRKNKMPQMETEMPQIEKTEPRIERKKRRKKNQMPQIDNTEPQIESKVPKTKIIRPRIMTINVPMEHKKPRILRKNSRIEKKNPPIDYRKISIERDVPPKDPRPNYKVVNNQEMDYNKLLLHPVVYLEKLKETADKSIIPKIMLYKNVVDTQCPETNPGSENNGVASDEINRVDKSGDTDPTKGIDPDESSATVDASRTRRETKSRFSSKQMQVTMDRLQMYSLRTLHVGEIDDFRMDLSTDDKFVKAKFKCLKCVRIFSTQLIEAAHFQRYHSETSGHLVCEVCECKFQDRKIFHRHVYSHKSVFKCKLCPNEDIHFYNFTQHFKSTHWTTYKFLKSQHFRDIPYRCGMCSQEFPCLESLNVHKHVAAHIGVVAKSKSKGKPYSCQTCGASYNSHRTIILHQHKVSQGLACKPAVRNCYSLKGSCDPMENKVNLAQNTVTLAQDRSSLPENKVNLAQDRLSLPENKVTLTQDNVTLAQDNVTLAQDRSSLPQNLLSIPHNIVSLTQNKANLTDNNAITPDNISSLTQNNLILPVNNIIITDRRNSTATNINITAYNTQLTNINLRSTKNNFSLTNNDTNLAQNNGLIENNCDSTQNRNRCVICDKDFRTIFAYRIHLVTVHSIDYAEYGNKISLFKLP